MRQFRLSLAGAAVASLSPAIAGDTEITAAVNQWEDHNPPGYVLHCERANDNDDCPSPLNLGQIDLSDLGGSGGIEDGSEAVFR